MAQDPAETVQLLYAGLNADPNVRRAGEQALALAATKPGFGTSLAQVTLTAEQPFGVRQLAGVILKNFIRQHWQEGTRHFVAPEVQEEEKAYIRQILPGGLCDAESKIRTAVGMAVAKVAEHDWPHAWPELTGLLVTAIRDRVSAAHVHGALRCLSMIASDIDEAQMPQVVPVLFPELKSIIASPEAYGISMQRRAMGVLHGCLGVLGLMRGVSRKEINDLVGPALPGLLEALVGAVAVPMRLDDAADIGCKLEAFRCVTVITQHFGKLVEPHMPAVLQGVWKFFSESVKDYDAIIVRGDGDDVNAADSDGDELNLETLMSQVTEYMLTVLSSSRLRSIVQHTIPEMIYLLARYMQMTTMQEELWINDAEQFIADEEDDTVSVRVSGEMLLDQIVDVFGTDTLQQIWTCAVQRLQEGEAERQAGSPHWWKVREAALLMVGTLAETLIEFMQPSDLEPLIDQLLQLDLGQAAQGSPFLRGRALWLTAKFAEILVPERTTQCLSCAVACLQPGGANPLPLRIAACRAITEFCPKLPLATIQPLMPSVYAGLCALLSEGSEEIVPVVLECVMVVVKADAASAVTMEATLVPGLLQVWAAYVNDPLIATDVIATISAFAKVPGCLPQLMSRLVPAIASIIANPTAHSETLVEGALDLLPVLLTPAAPEQVQAAHTALYSHILALGTTSEDNGTLQSAAGVLRRLVKSGGEAMLTWGPHPTPEENMNALLGVTARLLGPTLEDSAALYVGGLLRTLLRTLPNQIAPLLSQIVSAVVARLNAAMVPQLRVTLVLVFACMAHLSASGLVSLLQGMPAPEGCTEATALHFVMGQWTQWQPDIQGSYEIKLSTTALATLLATGSPVLGGVMVQGVPIVDESQGIVTRSRARVTGPPKFTTVTLPVKIFALLADSLMEHLEQQRGVQGDDEDDDEWEEDGDDDDDGFGEEVRFSGKGANFNDDDIFGLYLAGKEMDKEHLEEDLDALSDPINQTDMVTYLGGYVKAFAAQDANAFQACMQTLQKKQVEAVKKVLTA